MASGIYTAVQYDPNQDDFVVYTSDWNDETARSNEQRFPTRGEALCAAHDRGREVCEVDPLPRRVTVKLPNSDIELKMQSFAEVLSSLLRGETIQKVSPHGDALRMHFDSGRFVDISVNKKDEQWYEYEFTINS